MRDGTGVKRGRSIRWFMTRRVPSAVSWLVVGLVVLAIGTAVAAYEPRDEVLLAAPAAPRGADDPLVVEGFAGPESVKFDQVRGVWYVGNFNGPGGALDNNGMISRVRTDGTLDELAFIEGGVDGTTLHAPRGMTIVGDTLWVCDVDAIRAFDARTGEQLAAVDMTRWEPGFLNDIAADDSGTLYVTDTGRNRIYRVQGLDATIALEDSVLNRPNGITWHREEQSFVVVPFGGSRDLLSWRPGNAPESWRTLPTGGRYDGVEILRDGRVVLASQADSSVYVLAADAELDADSVRVRIPVAGSPADLGVDEIGERIVVPYIARNLVEFWRIPPP